MTIKMAKRQQKTPLDFEQVRQQKSTEFENFLKSKGLYFKDGEMKDKFTFCKYCGCNLSVIEKKV